MDDIEKIGHEAWEEVEPEMSGRMIGPGRKGVEETLDMIGPLPREALFLGVAYDEMPVLLNLHDPAPGPLLIEGAGEMLRVIAYASDKMHQDVQVAVVSSRPSDWAGFEKMSGVVGVFPVFHQSSEDLILSLSSWAHGARNDRTVVLIIIDDLGEVVCNMDFDALQNLRWLLLRGPARRVWPIISVKDKVEDVEPWLDAFRTRIYAEGSDFKMLEGGEWLKFWIPRL